MGVVLFVLRVSWLRRSVEHASGVFIAEVLDIVSGIDLRLLKITLVRYYVFCI